MIGIGRYSHLSRKIVRRSHRDDAEGYVVSVEPVHNFVDRSVAASRSNDVNAAPSGVGREGSGLPGLEGHEAFDEVAFLADPVDQMVDVRTVGSGAVYHEGDVFGRHVIR